MLHVNRDTSRGRTYGYTYELYLTIERVYFHNKEIRVQKIRFGEIEWTKENLKKIFSKKLGEVDINYDCFSPYLESPRRISITALKGQVRKDSLIHSKNDFKRFLCRLNKSITNSFSKFGPNSFRENGTLVVNKNFLLEE
ncbi:MAG: hypothetical protein ACRCXX_13745 [Cetobacterium sp.]|uniref:hypothetical protein n=1 Tax=Cetobacterium sp. TaxID=2071632 RepID=UPI003F362E25